MTKDSPFQTIDVFVAEFRMIMFRPYIGEAILGKVKSQGPEGIVGESPHLSR